MKAEEVLAWMDGARTYNRPWDVPDEAVDTIRELIAERDRLRAALESALGQASFSADAVAEYSPASASGYVKIRDIARAALEPRK